ncbi:MAG: 3'(2'),5'-bisphosphate nucleotidase CysQ [Saprospiraceae bacterium]|nr:3'(2'),5'-bisphosphate nucleotidase CysQ [Saprospiraceae bacterium]
MTDLSPLIQPLLKIAKEAGDAILKIYKNEEDFGVESKDDNSPLTRADKASNQVICDGLEALDPAYPIISEENKAIPYEERKDFEYCWLVDPLDGTKEFIKRNGEFTVNIALLHKNKPVFGVVYAPVLDEMYWAIKGEGAFLKKEGAIQQLTMAPFSMQDEGLHVVSSRSHMNEETKAFVEKLKNPELVSKGSSLKFLMIAKGEAEVYPRVAPTMEWDTGAAQIVLEEAGGKVLHFETGAPLDYNKENLLNPYFIAYGNVND